ncbi:MAG: DUF2207 domain-containing protein, partial [Armatimonadetes bacterium]|nr:DUF2207 domain-containing protein [Armatimonadota bacterium]
MTSRIEVLPDSKLKVTENWTYVFDGEWNGAYRDLYIRGCSGYSGFEVSENGKVYKQGSVDEKGGFIVETYGSTIRIKWRSRNVTDPPYDHYRTTFTVKYLVHGALDYIKDQDQLYWKPLPPHREFSIDEAIVTVVLPGTYPASQLSLDVFDKSASAEPLSDETTSITLRGRHVPPSADFEFRLRWPAGGVRRVLSINRLFNERLFLPLHIALALGLIVFLIVLHSRLGAEPATEEVASYLTEPPSDLRPGEVGCLLKQKASIRDILATILDLSARGFLWLAKVGPKRDDIVFRLSRVDDSLKKFERRVIEGLRLREIGSETPLSALREEFYETVNEVTQMLQDDLKSLGYWEQTPTSVRWSWFGYAVLAALTYLVWMLNTRSFWPRNATIVTSIIGIATAALAIFVLRTVLGQSRGVRALIIAFGTGAALAGATVNIGSLLNSLHLSG